PDLQGTRAGRSISDAARVVPARQGDRRTAGLLCRSVPEGDADGGIQGLYGKAGTEADLPHWQGHAAIPRGGRYAEQIADDRSRICREVAIFSLSAHPPSPRRRASADMSGAR